MFGPSFDSELFAAGLNGLPFWWNHEGAFGIDALTDDQKKTFQAVVSAHDPSKAAPSPVPALISDRQFFWGMYKQNMISRDDAMSAIKAGVTPPFVQTILNQITDQSARDDAEMLIMGAKEILRSHPSTTTFGHEAGMTDAQIDDFFRFCSTL